MKKIFIILLLPVLFACISCNKLTSEDVEAAVMAGETEKIPLIKQHLYFLDDITVDSIHIIVDQEPMSGYLYTTWVSDGKAEPIIVPVSDIHKSKKNKGYIEWTADWESTTKSYLMSHLMGDLL